MAKHMVISLHGIRTYGRWQERLGDLLHGHEKSIEYHAYTYGYFSVVAFLIPPIRWLVVRNFRKSLLQLCHREVDARVDLVAHSFGTHIIAWAIFKLPSYLRPRIHTIILAGSVLKPAFPWADLINAKDVYRVINDCGLSDTVLLLNQLTVLFTGMAGRVGIAGLTNNRLVNRFFRGGHSLYFVDASGRQSDEFMQRYWEPLLCNADPIQIVDERTDPTAWDGVVRTIVQNSEPLKLLAYIAILITPIFVYRNLYVEAVKERKAAFDQRHEADVARVLAITQRDAALHTLEWAINETAHLPYDWSTFPDDSPGLRLMSGLVMRLRASKFRGKLRIEGNVGVFCYRRRPHSTILDTPSTLKMCNEGGYSRETEIVLGERYAQSIRRILEPLITPGDGIEVTTVSHATERPLYCVPPEGTTITPLEWNEIAQLNNGVRIVLTPEGETEAETEYSCIPFVPRGNAGSAAETTESTK
jgi:hypothetical protein